MGIIYLRKNQFDLLMEKNIEKILPEIESFNRGNYHINLLTRQIIKHKKLRHKYRKSSLKTDIDYNLNLEKYLSSQSTIRKQITEINEKTSYLARQALQKITLLENLAHITI